MPFSTSSWTSSWTCFRICPRIGTGGGSRWDAETSSAWQEGHEEAWSRVKVEKLFFCMVRGGSVLPKCFSCVVRGRTVLPKCFSCVVWGGTVLPKCFSCMVRGRIMPEKCFSCLIRIWACRKTDFSCLFRCQTWHKRHKFYKNEPKTEEFLRFCAATWLYCA